MSVCLDCSHVVDLGDLVVERLLQVALALDVALDLAEALHALHIHGHLLVLSKELVLSQPLHKVALLQKIEVKECQVLTNQIFLGAESGNKRSHFLLSGLAKCGSIGTDVAWSGDGALDFLELAVEHVDLGFLFGRLAKELGSVGSGQVDHDGGRISQLGVAVDQIGDRGEVQVEGVLN